MTEQNPESNETGVQDTPHVSPATTAFFIGFLVGIVIFSVAVNAWGVSLIIPLYLLYRLLKS